MVAALFVRHDTVYRALGCDCYDERRDALTWRGGSPGVFHPPCRAWGNLSHFSKHPAGEPELALWAMQKVRQEGGVLEHPANSRLWRVSGCGTPGVRDAWGGVLVYVYQRWWGHRAQKRTGLYIVGPVPAFPYDVLRTERSVEQMGKREREATPLHLAKFLVAVAEAARAG